MIRRDFQIRWLRWALLLSLLAALAAFLLADRYDAKSRGESYPKSNYSAIEDGLLLGGMLSELPEGIGAVLNVGETRDCYVAKHHCWEPIADLGPPPTVTWLRSQVEFINKHEREGTRVYVHCRAGVNRSVMVLAAYLMWRDGLTADEATERIREKRPRAGPYEVYRAFLKEWEKELNKPPHAD
jgi:hypothetical protein